MAARALNTSQYSEPCTSLSPLCHDQPSLPLQLTTYVHSWPFLLLANCL